MNAQKRAQRVRFAIRKKSKAYRLSIHRTNLNIYAQIIDDQKGITLAHASTLSKEFENIKGTGKELAEQVGRAIGKLAKARNIERVVLDRGANTYHGRIAALADGARAEGLQF